MKLVVGLGNPGAKFKNTRHNIGFMVVDKLAIRGGLSWRFSRDWMCFFIKSSDCVIIKPSTYMNRSGHAVLAVAHFFKIESKDILVVHDDLDLEFGKIRISFDSTSAGHKGVESIIERLASLEFGRLRVGIGHPSRKASADAKALADRTDGEPSLPVVSANAGALADRSDDKQTDPEKYVLEEFGDVEQKQLEGIIDNAIEAVDSYLQSGIAAAMNRFN